MQKAEQIGLEGFLIKPVNPSVMFNTIMEVFGREPERGPRIPARQQPSDDTLQKIRGARILLAEDNEINQQVAKEILTGAGLKVSLAVNGQAAVDAVQKTKFDAVLMDIQMPVMDGYEATRRIRKAEVGMGKPEDRGRKTEDRGQRTDDSKQNKEDQQHAVRREPCAVSLPIIAMTAHAMAGDREKSLAAGLNDHVAKPIDPDELFKVLGKWILPAADREPNRISPAVASKDKPQTVVDAAAARPQSDMAEDEFPQVLAGFDLQQGLQRLQGNRKLYRKLLLDFAADYASTADEIFRALTGEDMDQAHRLVHNRRFQTTPCSRVEWIGCLRN